MKQIDPRHWVFVDESGETAEMTRRYGRARRRRGPLLSVCASRRLDCVAQPDIRVLACPAVILSPSLSF